MPEPFDAVRAAVVDPRRHGDGLAERCRLTSVPHPLPQGI